MSSRLAETKVQVAAERARWMDMKHASLQFSVRRVGVSRSRYGQRSTAAPAWQSCYVVQSGSAPSTVTFQLPKRYRLRRQARARTAAEFNSPADPPAPVSAAALEVALGRRHLERRTDAMEAASASGAASEVSTA